jgi:hypothetical protein
MNSTHNPRHIHGLRSIIAARDPAFLLVKNRILNGANAATLNASAPSINSHPAFVMLHPPGGAPPSFAIRQSPKSNVVRFQLPVKMQHVRSIAHHPYCKTGDWKLMTGSLKIDRDKLREIRV